MNDKRRRMIRVVRRMIRVVTIRRIGRAVTKNDKSKSRRMIRVVTISNKNNNILEE